jgi:hypothetical protein
MKKEAFKKQVLGGIAGALGTALVAAAVYLQWGFPENRWITYAVGAICVAAFIGFLLFIPGGWKSFFSGARYGFGLMTLVVSAKELPSWAFCILIVAAVSVFLVRPLIRQYRGDRDGSGDAVPDEELADEIAAEEEIQREMEGFKKSIAFGDKSLLLKGAGGMHQLIRSGGKLYFIRLGGELSGMDTKLARTDFSDEAAYIGGKKDFYIDFNRIAAIQLSYGKRSDTPMENCGKMTMRTDQKAYAFTVWDHLPEEKLAAFFSGLPFSVRVKKRAAAPVPAHVPTAKEKGFCRSLKKPASR